MGQVLETVSALLAFSQVAVHRLAEFGVPLPRVLKASKALSALTVDALRGQALDITSPLTAALLWIISLGFGLTGLFVFARSDRSGDVLRVSFLFLVVAIALALAPAAARWHPWAMVVETISIDWATALFFIFFYMFWRSSSGISSQPWAVWAMAAWALSIDVSYLLVFTILPDIFSVVRVFALAQVVVGLIAGVAFLVRAFLSVDSVVKKEQSRIMLVGIAAGVLPFPYLVSQQNC